MKKTILIILSFVCLFIITIVIRNSNHKKIITDQGDIFYVTIDTYLNKTSISTEDGLTFRYDGYEDRESFLCIWEQDNIRAYLFGNKIIFKYGEEQFQLINNIKDLEQNKKMEPVIKSVLFKSQVVLDTYLSYYLTNYPNEFDPLINDFLQGNYTELSKYGFDNSVPLNPYVLESFKETINSHLNQLKE